MGIRIVAIGLVTASYGMAATYGAFVENITESEIFRHIAEAPQIALLGAEYILPALFLILWTGIGVFISSVLYPAVETAFMEGVAHPISKMFSRLEKTIRGKIMLVKKEAV